MDGFAEPSAVQLHPRRGCCSGATASADGAARGRGRLVVPVGEQGESQVLLEIQRTDKETFTKRELMGVSYVPLVRQRTEL